MSNIIKGEESKEIELEKNTLENTICLNYQDGYSDVCHNEEYLDKLKDKLYTETVIPKQFFEGYKPQHYFKTEPKNKRNLVKRGEYMKKTFWILDSRGAIILFVIGITIYIFFFGRSHRCQRIFSPRA